MGVILSTIDLAKAFDSRPLFKNVCFAIEDGERIGLIGPNGAGKSTLLRILASQIDSDDGSVVFQKGLKISYLEQNPQMNDSATVLETILEGSEEPTEWKTHTKAEELLWKLGLEAGGIHSGLQISALSGGWKKRVAIARELMREPDLFLMDEPTNHLDVEGIIWLEDLISSAPFASLTITHDRLFLQRISTRILELDRRNPGGILSVKGNYTTYLETKESMMTSQENREFILKGNLRRETAWLKAGVKARTTKQQARIDRHEELSEEVAELAERNKIRRSQMEFQAAENNPKRLLEAKQISKSFDGKTPLFSKLDLLLTPSTRIGIMGANASGKSTLIRVLLGIEKPDSGKLFWSDQLKPIYFQQNRSSLDPSVSLLRTVCPFGDHVHYRGKQMHIRSYLDRFLFSPTQMDMNIGSLSGGEQSRVLIAKLMLEEANLLVLDEPTNDLDLETLNVLQECLTQFEGAILLVSHDRYFLDQVSTQILAFPVTPEDKKKGQVLTFADLAQWEIWHQNAIEISKAKKEKNEKPVERKVSVDKENQRAQEKIMKKIEKAETQLSLLEKECHLPENASDLTKLSELGLKMQKLHDEIELLYKSWEGLN